MTHYKTNEALSTEPGAEDLYWRLHSLSKILEGSGRLDEYACPDAYATILDAMQAVRPAPATELREQQSAERGEPVAWMYDVARYGPTDLRGQQWRPAISRTKPNMHDSLVRDTTPLYTFSPANANAGKPWVGLTDEEQTRLVVGASGWNNPTSGFFEVARAIEDALRGKNT